MKKSVRCRTCGLEFVNGNAAVRRVHEAGVWHQNITSIRRWLTGRWTYREIAKKLGVSAASIGQSARRAGIKRNGA